eukprot:CAMPEP_0183331102 /NCGR_PEP_ID=MMETSP0164_2-20130417/506_1 /TAXON_ID=221442 /ORGANISM="Coccolithus pelagicus ssp braarudi, Strain PLY182g" /LENGTH=42 /DNA_ID= /DNA_START= /DNA_END= /DNA_ORIENTATION=
MATPASGMVPTGNEGGSGALGGDGGNGLVKGHVCTVYTSSLL